MRYRHLGQGLLLLFIVVFRNADWYKLSVSRLCFYHSHLPIPSEQYIGVGLAAYFGGMSLRESSVIAALMNTRGLVELIVLNLGDVTRFTSTSLSLNSNRFYQLASIMSPGLSFAACHMFQVEAREYSA